MASLNYDLEYGVDTISVQVSDVKLGWKILLVDDLIATGGSAEAAAGLIESLGANISQIMAVIGLPFLGFRERLEKYNVFTLIDYDGE